MIVVPTVGTTVNWPRDSQKLDLYISEEGIYELLFSSQQPKAKDFRRHCCNVLFPYVWQQLTNKMKENHQQAIEEKDAAVALLNDDLENHEYKNVALQAQRDVYQAQVLDLIVNRHVPRAKDPSKDNIVVIIEKNTAPEEDEFYEYPCYIARAQRRFISIKTRLFRAQYPHHRPIIEDLVNANSIHAFNRFEEKGYEERFQCHFRLADIPRDALHALAMPAIQE